VATLLLVAALLLLFLFIVYVSLQGTGFESFLQCFDAVGWAF